MLNSNVITVSPTQSLHVIDFKDFSVPLKAMIDRLFVRICEGESDSDLKRVKARLSEFLSTKSDSIKMGAVAEFVVHLYLNQLGLKQEFLYFNLEEGSVKKGFDGLFSRESKIFLVESKSGSINTEGISHRSKLATAYSDLKKYVEGKSEKGNNNPWRNAFNHASHLDVATEKGIRKKIKQLSDMYDSKEYTRIERYNVVPCSTIYLDSTWDESESIKVARENEFVKDFVGMSVLAVCVTKASLKSFIEYLGE